MKVERKAIHDMLAPHVHKGEELYYEIYGYELSGAGVQTNYPYDCVYLVPTQIAFEALFSDDNKIPLPYKVMLYRVTVTTEDGYRIDLSREEVYKRAEELGLEKPTVLHEGYITEDSNIDVLCEEMIDYAKGRSVLDAGTLLEGIVVWFKNRSGQWTCLKHKSEEFLLEEDKHRSKGGGDVEDEL
jgi:hypothetical protein